MLHSISLIQVAEPISTWKVYFRSPPGEVYARNLKSTLGVSHCAQSGENFFSLLGFFFLKAVGAKWGRQQRERTLESKRKRLDGKNKLVKENATRSIFCRLDPIAAAFACSFIAVFSFLVRFFRFFEVVHGHFHGLNLFIPKKITPRKMLAWWLINWVASSSHQYNTAKFASDDCVAL